MPHAKYNTMFMLQFQANFDIKAVEYQKSNSKYQKFKLKCKRKTTEKNRIEFEFRNPKEI